MLERQGDGYRLGMWLFERGELVPEHRSLSDAALPLMEDLREVTRQRVHLAVLEGVDVVYVEILGTGGIDVASRTGGRFPAHATGVGKAMLAYSPAATVRARVDAGADPVDAAHDLHARGADPRAAQDPLRRDGPRPRGVPRRRLVRRGTGVRRRPQGRRGPVGHRGDRRRSTRAPSARRCAPRRFTLSRLLRESGL